MELYKICRAPTIGKQKSFDNFFHYIRQSGTGSSSTSYDFSLNLVQSDLPSDIRLLSKELSEKVYFDSEHRSKLSDQILENYAESLNNYLPNILLRFRFKRLYYLKQKFVQIVGSIPLMNEIIHQIKDKKILAQFKSTNSENPELLEELSNLKKLFLNHKLLCVVLQAFIHFLKSKTDIEKIIVPMTTCLNHRGPDRTNFSILDNGFAMGHTRLSIQDLSEAGNQPMQSLSGRFTIVFNGEIYNHFELRKELRNKYSKKIAWRGSSDTETLLEYFEVCGIEKTLKNALGMFAFAIHDSKSNSLILARDRFGEKATLLCKAPKRIYFLF